MMTVDILNDVVFIDALRQAMIPYPVRPKKYSKFLRWGKNGRYWAAKIDSVYIYGDFVKNLSFTKCEKSGENTYSEYDKAYAINEAMKYFEAEKKEAQEYAKIRAEKIWNSSANLKSDFQYLLDKKVISYGLKVTENGKIIIPLRDIKGTITTLQFIDEKGKKIFLKDGQKKGSFFQFGSPGDVIFFAEGYATACSIFLATGECSIMCVDCGNMETVGKEFACQYPDKTLIFCGDNDRFNGDVNVGRDVAIQTAREVKGKYIIPWFDDKDDISTDFNDLYCFYGVDEVLNQLSFVWNSHVK